MTLWFDAEQWLMILAVASLCGPFALTIAQETRRIFRKKDR